MKMVLDARTISNPETKMTKIAHAHYVHDNAHGNAHGYPDGTFSYADVYSLPNHLKIHHFPRTWNKDKESDDLICMGFGPLSRANQHFARWMRKGNRNYLVEICYATDLYGEIRAQDIYIADNNKVSLTPEQFQRFQYLVSEDAANKRIQTESARSKAKMQCFQHEWIDQDNLARKVKEWTEEYLTEFLGDNAVGAADVAGVVDMFCIQKLAKSAETNFVKHICDWFKKIQENQDLNGGEITDALKRVMKDPFDDEPYDDEMYEIVSDMQHTMFYHNYPVLDSFANKVASLTKGESKW